MPTSTLGQRVEHAHLAFALAVQGKLVAGGATCWSPYSVASALGLAATGARGATRDELAALLAGSPGAQLADHGAMLGEAATLPADGPGTAPVLAVANTLWHAPELHVRPEFLTELAGWPNPAAREAPFATNEPQARQLINTDVADTTHDLITGLIGPGVIKPDTVAMLINALYLKTTWRSTFESRDTEPEPFHGARRTAAVPTMRLRKRLGYASADGWTVVTMPAAGDVEAAILLPDGDIGAAESTLDADALATLLAAPDRTLVQLFLPRFTVRAKTELDAALRALGVHTMYDQDAADFSGIARERMSVDSVMHEAVLKVNEKGVEGAAATAVRFRALALHTTIGEPVVVRVDRPFLFLVRHVSSGAVYFLARVTQP